MKKVKLAFHAIIILYIISSVIILLTDEWFLNFFGEYNFRSFVKYWAWGGIALFLVLWVIDVFRTNFLKGQMRKLEFERNEIKAKLYDIDQTGKESVKEENQPIKTENQQIDDQNNNDPT
ncbi:hypothetical protein QQ008_04455 [Fulvivirgaceae bacterium BMA10]|uniref:2TM domain-containing protein n=1 Tax=Splendidivirga corallicola TaxID=3051826 RepID=A0ABT8KK25_9BACT|nr:hypothetical protein [Fulvivirgaceae bacterium BMA10]